MTPSFIQHLLCDDVSYLGAKAELAFGLPAGSGVSRTGFVSAVGATGAAVIAWSEWTSSGTVTKAVKRTAGIWGPVETITGSYRPLDALVDDVTGAVTLAVTTNSSPSSVRLMRNAGSGWQLLSSASTGVNGSPLYGRLFDLGGGVFRLLYSTQYYIYTVRLGVGVTSMPSLVAGHDAVGFSNAVFAGRLFATTIESNQVLHLVYLSDTGVTLNQRLRWIRSTDGGQTFSTPLDLTPGFPGACAITTDSTGRVVVAYSTNGFTSSSTQVTGENGRLRYNVYENGQWRFQLGTYQAGGVIREAQVPDGWTVQSATKPSVFRNIRLQDGLVTYDQWTSVSSGGGGTSIGSAISISNDFSFGDPFTLGGAGVAEAFASSMLQTHSGRHAVSMVGNQGVFVRLRRDGEWSLPVMSPEFAGPGFAESGSRFHVKISGSIDRSQYMLVAVKNDGVTQSAYASLAPGS